MSIDASKLVNIVPRIIGGGGNSLEFNGMMLTQNPLIPAGAVTQWADATTMGKFFGLLAEETTLGALYFNGFDNSNIKPDLLYVARMVTEPVAAWLRGAAFTGTLAELKAITDGGLSATINDTAVNVSGVSFATAASFSDVGLLLQAALDASLAGVTVTYSSLTKAFQINSPTTGEASTIVFAAAPASGTDLSSLLNLTEQTGALLSQGMNAQTPLECMQNILNYTRNWVLFMTVWEPDFDDKMAFARWVNDFTKVRNGYICWDTDINATNPFSTASFGAQVKELELWGTCPVYNTPELAAFVLGTGASIDWNERNGRITWAFKSQSGLAVTCDDTNVYDALIGNGYCCYADFHTANDNFKFFQNGQISGDFKWLDTYCDAIAINNDLQLALMTLFANAKSLPYNQKGYDRVIAACLDPIQKYLNFGAIVPGVPLSNAQAAQVNTEAGVVIAPVLTQEGWYLQILPATSQVRANRGSPPSKFWWMDGGSIQKIDMSSTGIL